MPQVSKQALSQYLSTGCLRQLALNLRPDNSDYSAERISLNMPAPQPPRPGLQIMREAGEEWQAAKLNDLTNTFGIAAIVGNSRPNNTGGVTYAPIPLATALNGVSVFSFLVEPEFQIGGEFLRALGIDSRYAQLQIHFTRMRPDLIQVLPSQTFTSGVTSGGEVFQLAPNDNRQQLRVIDIKLTAKASQGYFAEIALYTLALASWLVEHGLDSSFVVVTEAALWPGSHEASNLVRAHRNFLAQGQTPSPNLLCNAIEQDLEPLPFEVFSIRVRRFLQVEVPDVVVANWQQLEWHVDSRCAHCEYLGEPRPNYVTDQLHCIPLASQTDHLSRVAFVSQGARISLQQGGIGQVAALAGVQPADPIFDAHQSLRATRTIVSGRAASFNLQQAIIPPQTGTVAGMPRWADLHICLSADFDLGSAITVGLGMKAFWYEPRPFNSPLTANRRSQSWPPQGSASVQIVDQKDLAVEERELLAFLRQIHGVLSWCDTQDQQALANPQLAALSPITRANNYTTRMQVYMWDSLQYEHLTRIIGRHLAAILRDPTINYLAWLFPPEDILPNAELATRRSPVTIVRDVVRSLLAAPIAHHYSLLEVARVYHEPTLPAAISSFSIHPLFEVPLSDQIPSERAHEIWGRVTAPRHWQQQLSTYQETIRKKLIALETVSKRLESDLRNQLGYNAPRTNVGPPAREARISVEGQLWLAFSRLNASLSELEVHRLRAMPPHERTARFASAHLTTRLFGAQEVNALTQLGIQPRAGRRVYEIAADSIDIKAKVDDFNFALSPRNQIGFLDRKIASLVQGSALANQYGNDWSYVERATKVSIVALDRNLRLIVLDCNTRDYPTFLDDLTNGGICDFDHDLMLDPMFADYFTGKLKTALRAIGNPPIAASHPLVGATQLAVGQRPLPTRPADVSPAADFIWGANLMSSAQITRNLGPVRVALVSSGMSLNASQWHAWEQALSYRARLVWGPPGTGKSRTVSAIIAGAALEAANQGRSLRILLSASTYTAIDNVLLPVSAQLQSLVPSAACYRLRSSFQATPQPTPSIDVELNRSNPSPNVRQLRSRLDQNQEITIVASTPEQIHNLLTCDQGNAQAEWFDLIIIDEASQMDVSHAILPLATVAENGTVVLAGDPKQLPPIHQAEAPSGLENLVGSIYSMFENTHRVQVCSLDVNYRSNDVLVDFARRSGYQSSLTSHSPNLMCEYVSPLPLSQPPNWPHQRFWSQEFAHILDPTIKTCCFVYDDGISGQRNLFEAQTVSSLTFLLNGMIADQLRNEVDPVSNRLKTPGTSPYGQVEFWEKAIGIVTPHRAQQGLIASDLQALFGTGRAVSDAIRNAVDTVERFQGQERDVIIASFAVGDPDQIGDEEEFLLSLNRFNVMASRARAKLIVLVSRQVVDHLAREVEVLRDSRLLKVFVESFCCHSRPINLGYFDNGNLRTVSGDLKWR
jgi:DNA replication ATP-dependent helicase Dna2